MGSIPVALSIHHYINSVGADAGFAALVGLAILVLLYFAQARETSSLREQAAESAQRVEQLEARLAQLGQTGASSPEVAAATLAPQSRGAAAAGTTASATSAAGATPSAIPATGATPSAATAGARSPAPVAGAVSRSPAPAPVTRLEPAAPAGVAAPALAAATRLIPVKLAASSERVTQPATAAGAAVAEHPIEDTAFVSAASAAAARGSNGLAAAAAGNHGGGATAPPAPPPRVPTRISGGVPPPSKPAPSRPLLGAPTGSRVPPRALVLMVTGLLVAGVVATLLIVTSGNGNSSTTTTHKSTGSATASTPRTHVVAFNPRSVKLAVLNGTATAGLAARIASKLQGRGYSVGTTTNAVDQTSMTSVVAYTPGQRRAALAVAQSLGLSAAAVQPIDQNTQQIACPPPSHCANTVVVTAGADLASST